MLTLSPEQVRTLAPDASAARAGEALGGPRHWTAAGRNDVAAWGLCQGSGSSPYQVAVDISGPAYKCSCPSRKIPCKHSLGLLFLVADGGAQSAIAPDWAQAWLESRATRAAAAATRSERSEEVDPEARAKRIATRERKVAGGIDELDRWLHDLMRRGLDSTRSEGYRFWDAMGARLVDAQAGGLGRSVRGLASAANSGEAWPHVLLEGAGRLHLLSEAYRHADRLPEDLRADVRSLVGWNVREEELDAATSVADRWLVVGQRIDDRGDLVTARTYLLGEASGRLGLHLAFGVGAAPPTLLGVPGQAFRATATFHPSATPLRVAVQLPIEPDGEITAVPAPMPLTEVVREHADRLARNPFAGAWPVVIGDVVPVLRADRLFVRDLDGRALPISGAEVAPRLLAISGGHPLALVAEWDGAWLRPLATFADGRLASVTADVEAPEPRIDDPDWSGLVSAALLGTERTGGNVPIPPAVAGLVADGDPEQGLLAAAGAMAVRRRAGRTTAVDETPLGPAAEEDRRPQLSGAAARYVGMAFEERPSLVPEVLSLVGASGKRLPDEWLPNLMALANRTADVDAALDLGGSRAVWLARSLPELAGDLPWGADDDWDAAWSAAGGGAARASLLRRFRRVDVAGARTSLAAWWPAVAPEDRARVIAAIETNLDPADEALLGEAIADRRSDVRRAAADLLLLLPDAALTHSLEAVARPLLQSGGLVRKSLRVELPVATEELDALGLTGRPAPGYGDRAWLLRQLLARIRPSRWNAWLNVDPAGLVDQAVRSDEARPLLEGWIEATSRFGDAAWASAILRTNAVPSKIMTNVAAVVDRLPPNERTEAVTEVARAIDPQLLARLAATVPAIWPAPLADAVLAVARDAGRELVPGPGLSELVRVAALGVEPGRAEELETIASHNGELRPSLADAIETIRLRARIHAAFA